MDIVVFNTMCSVIIYCLGIRLGYQWAKSKYKED